MLSALFFTSRPGSQEILKRIVGIYHSTFYVGNSQQKICIYFFKNIPMSSGVIGVVGASVVLSFV